MTTKDRAGKDIAGAVAGAISATLVGFLSALSRLFSIDPQSFRKPGDRPNAPPPSGGVSSLD